LNGKFGSSKGSEYWKNHSAKKIAEHWGIFKEQRVAGSRQLRAIRGTIHATTLKNALDNAFRAAKTAYNNAWALLAGQEAAAQAAITIFVAAIDAALEAAEGQGALLLLRPPVPASDPHAKKTEFNPSTSTDFVRFGMWRITEAGGTLTATAVGTACETVAHNPSSESKKSFVNTTKSMIATSIDTLKSGLTTTVSVVPQSDDKRHAEDTWFHTNAGALTALRGDAANIVRFEVLVTVTMCDRCRDNYMALVRRVFPDVPIFIYTFRDDVMPQKTGPTASADARSQSIWQVNDTGEIVYRGVWGDDNAATFDAFVYKY
jgi:hypothetical protein